MGEKLNWLLSWSTRFLSWAFWRRIAWYSSWRTATWISFSSSWRCNSYCQTKYKNTEHQLIWWLFLKCWCVHKSGWSNYRISRQRIDLYQVLHILTEWISSWLIINWWMLRWMSSSGAECCCCCCCRRRRWRCCSLTSSMYFFTLLWTRE